jgi:beta-barrel assembly-enhancing protease
MKRTVLCFVAACAVATPAYAQFGAIGKIKDRVDQAKKISEMHISDKDEHAIGEAVSRNVIAELGVYPNAALTKYVTLVGTVLAQASERPTLQWQFIVLDTDGVNAYAAPGGFIHITRGALALIKSEAELAGVLAHEIIHVTSRHSIKSIQRSKGLSIASDEFSAQGGLMTSAITKLAEKGTDILLFNEFDRGQEMESDKLGLQLANKVGYSPAGLTSFLNHLAERNKDRKEKNGLFATHPQLQERIEENGKTARDKKLTATAMVEPRYASAVKVEAAPMAAIAMVPRGVRGAAAADSAEAKNEPNEEKKPEPKKGRFGLGSLGSALSKGKQAESTQASASAGGRMVGPDTNAAGGSNRNPVRVVLTPAEIAEFKKGIV